MKAWIHKLDLKLLLEVQQDNETISRYIWTRPPVSDEKEKYIEFELPDPPEPWEGEVWVRESGVRCAYQEHHPDPRHEGCRKIKVREIE